MSTLCFITLVLFQPFWAGVCYIFTLKRKCPTSIDCIIWALIISLLGIYWFPWGDNQTHFAAYYSDLANQYYSLSLTNSHFLYDYIISKIAHFTGNYVWGYFFWIFSSLSLFFYTTWSLFIRNKHIYNASGVFLLLLLIIGMREILDLTRNTVSILFLISALNIWGKHKFYSTFLIIISYLLHSSVLPVIILGTILQLVLKASCSKKYFYIIIITVLISAFSTVILQRFAPERVIDSYLTGTWGTGTGVGSRFAYLTTMVNCAIFFIFVYFIIKNADYLKHNNIFNFYFASLLICIFVWFYWVLRERILICNIVLGAVIIISNWEQICSSDAYNSFNRCLKLIIGLCIIRTLLIFAQTYSANFVFFNGATDPIRSSMIVANGFLLPTPLLLDIDEYGFNDDEYLNNYSRVKETISNVK